MTADRRDWVEGGCKDCGNGIRGTQDSVTRWLENHICSQNSGEEKKPCWDCGRSDGEQTPCCSGCLEASVSPSKATEASPWDTTMRKGRTVRTILEEAGELVDGPREAHYGHPYDDGTKFIGAFNALFKDYLSKPLEVKHWPLMMILVKLSREIHESKRDNIVDTAGYARVIEKILEREQELEDQIDAGEYR